jgi:transposase
MSGIHTIQRAYKVELDLNNMQMTACKQHAGAARWAYNWGLQRKQDAYRTTGKSPNAMELHRELNALKQTAVPWMYAGSKCAPQEALRNLDRAFAGFFARGTLKKAGKVQGPLGYPKRKSRKQGLGSFRLTGSIAVFPAAIQLPRLGRLRLKERGYLPTSGVKLLSATVSEQGGHWYVSVQVEHEQVVPENAGPVVGVDLGINRLATLSDGAVAENPRPLKRRLKKLKRLQRAVSRKVRAARIARRRRVSSAANIEKWRIRARTRCIV